VTDVRDRLAIVETDGARVERVGETCRLVRPPASAVAYADAELAGRYPLPPPATLNVRARFSHPAGQLRGTAGIGFWNAAIAPGRRRIGLPRAAWFFVAGPPYDVPLALDVPGRGFKAATLDAKRLAFLALLPTAPLGFLAMRNRWLYRRLWPIAQRAMRAGERALPEADLTVVHDYTVRWDIDRVAFAIDSHVVFETPTAPGGPLYAVVWIDNAYAIVTPRGHFELGTINIAETQWIEVERFEVTGRVALA
jgi:hypothetical protein